MGSLIVEITTSNVLVICRRFCSDVLLICWSRVGCVGVKFWRCVNGVLVMCLLVRFS